MGKMARTIVLSGYYGFANSGDEAVLHAIITALRQEAAAAEVDLRVIVLSGNPAETARIHGVEAAHRMRPFAVLRSLMRADALVSGGGSLLQDVTSAKSMHYYLAVIRLAQWLGKPVFIYAQGIGPIARRNRFAPMIRTLFQRCRYISVRDPESKALVASFGLDAGRIEVVPDPVMGLGNGVKAAKPDGGVRRLGVSVRFWREDRRELEAIAEGLIGVMEERGDVQVELLPFHLPADRQASEFVADRMAGRASLRERIHIHRGTEHPRDMLKEVAACDALLGMRLHSLIYAATSGVPPIAVSYDPKIDYFMHWLGETPVGATETLEAEQVKKAVLLQLDLGKTAWCGDKYEIIGKMQQNSLKPAQQIFREFRI